MEHVFSFMTLAFGGMLMLYAGLLRLTLDVRMIPKYHGEYDSNSKGYAKKLANILFFIALSFVAGGWAAFYVGPVIGAVILAACLAAAIWLGVRIWRLK